MEEKVDCIEFETEDGQKVSFFVVEQTTLAGKDYLLVTDSEEQEAQAYILQKVTDDQNQQVYEMLEDDEELEALSKIFEELLEDVEIEL